MVSRLTTPFSRSERLRARRVQQFVSRSVRTLINFARQRHVRFTILEEEERCTERSCAATSLSSLSSRIRYGYQEVKIAIAVLQFILEHAKPELKDVVARTALLGMRLIRFMHKPQALPSPQHGDCFHKGVELTGKLEIGCHSCFSG